MSSSGYQGQAPYSDYSQQQQAPPPWGQQQQGPPGGAWAPQGQSPGQQWGPPQGWAPQGQSPGGPPQGQWGQPPAQQWQQPQQGPPAGYYGGGPPPQWNGAPPQNGGWGQPGQYQQQQPPHQPAHANPVFKWSSPNATILNSVVRDPRGREIFTIETPKKKETVIKDVSGKTIAELQWHSTPTIEIHGSKAIKMKEWIPWHADVKARILKHNGNEYAFGGDDGIVYIYKNGSKSHIAAISDPEDMTHLEVFPEALPLLEELVIISTIFQCPNSIEGAEEKKGWFNPQLFAAGFVSSSIIN